jgi:hypothetical protein
MGTTTCPLGVLSYNFLYVVVEWYTTLQSRCIAHTTVFRSCHISLSTMEKPYPTFTRFCINPLDRSRFCA